MSLTYTVFKYPVYASQKVMHPKSMPVPTSTPHRQHITYTLIKSHNITALATIRQMLIKFNSCF
jgi:hypothetical protein